MPEDKSKEDLEKKLEVEVEEPTEQTTVEVDPNKQEVEQKEDPKYVTEDEFKKMHNRNEYLNRQLNRTMKTIEDLNAKLSNAFSPQQPQQQVESNLDELDEIAQKDWKKAVEMIGEKAAQKVLESKLKEQQEQAKQQELLAKLDQSKQKVVEKYPAINDPNSEISQLYNEVLNQNNDYLTHPSGPVLAMRDMEDMMRERGIEPPEIRQQIKSETQREIARRQRAGLSSVPQGRPVPNDNKVVLTQDEVATAKSAGIPLSEYAKYRKLQEGGNFKEGVTVDEQTE